MHLLWYFKINFTSTASKSVLLLKVNIQFEVSDEQTLKINTMRRDHKSSFSLLPLEIKKNLLKSIKINFNFCDSIKKNFLVDLAPIKNYDL